MHLSGFHASIYWAKFPAEYLRIIHSVGVGQLPDRMRIQLYHTPPYNLLDHHQRTAFLKHFIALVRFLAAGFGDVGHLRRTGTKIHREGEIKEVEKDSVAPDWMVLDYQEDEHWIREYGTRYES